MALRPFTQRDLDEMLAQDPSLRWLVHGLSDIAVAPSIAVRGIVPGSELEEHEGRERTWGGRYRSRDGCVYMGTEHFVADHMVDICPVFEVDITQLDPALMSCDEDHVAIYVVGDRGENHRIAQLLPEHFHVHEDRGAACDPWEVRHRRSSTLPRTPSRKGRLPLGEWAARPAVAAHLDSADFVRASLLLGSISYQGIVGPEAIRINPRWWKENIVEQADGWLLSTTIQGLAVCVGLLAPAAERPIMIEQLIRSHNVQDTLADLLRHIGSGPEAATENSWRGLAA